MITMVRCVCHYHQYQQEELSMLVGACCDILQAFYTAVFKSSHTKSIPRLCAASRHVKKYVTPFLKSKEATTPIMLCIESPWLQYPASLHLHMYSINFNAV